MFKYEKMDFFSVPVHGILGMVEELFNHLADHSSFCRGEFLQESPGERALRTAVGSTLSLSTLSILERERH